MTQVILLIGPSGVGKSDYGRFAAQQIPECRFADLDELVRQEWNMPPSVMLPQIGNDQFRERCEQEVRKMAASESDGTALVAVGAGALQSTGSGIWVSGHYGLAIAVVGSPEEVFGRGGPRNVRRTVSQFRETEYSQHREQLYRKAAYRCDVTGLSLDEARQKFVEMVRGLRAQAALQVS